MVVLRPVKGHLSLVYGFVDASGEGFGGSTRCAAEGVREVLAPARISFWCSEISEKSSNYREFRNLKEHVKAEAQKGCLAGKEVWIYTDNEVTEQSWFNGSSSERTLFEIVLNLQQEMIAGNVVLRVVHVAGTRMIGKGTDALSRGEIHARDLMNQFTFTVPLNRTAIQRVPELEGWLKTWMGPDSRIASPEHWFGEATQQHDYSRKTVTWVWDLPPAAAIYALEELGLGRNKRHDVLRGAVIVPPLMNPSEWFRRFSRIVNVYFSIPAGSSVWGRLCHEPFFVGLYLPLVRCSPWDWQKVPFFGGFARKVSSVLKIDYQEGCDLLREFWLSAIWIQRMPQLLVSDLLSDPHYHRFLDVAKKGSGNWTRGYR
jgi:hypothetical protein